MNSFELQLVREGLELLDDGLSKFDEDSDNELIGVISRLIHSAIVVGESIVGKK